MVGWKPSQDGMMFFRNPLQLHKQSINGRGSALVCKSSSRSLVALGYGLPCFSIPWNCFHCSHKYSPDSTFCLLALFHHLGTHKNALFGLASSHRSLQLDRRTPHEMISRPRLKVRGFRKCARSLHVGGAVGLGKAKALQVPKEPWLMTY